MLKNKFANLIKKEILSTYKFNKKYFQLLTAEEYIVNMKESNRRFNVESCRLNPLPEANHDPKNTRCRLFSVPNNKLDRSLPLISEMSAKYNPDLIFIQLEPMPYIVRQRYLSHKCALHGVEDYDLKGVENLNDPHPISWEEAIVNPIVLDMSYANQIHNRLDYTKGFTTYSSPQLQEKSVHDNLTNKFVQAVTDYVICDKWSPYHEINNILFEGVMTKQKVLLGDMPEILLRQIIGNTISIGECRDIFKSVLKHLKESNGELDMQSTSLYFYSHIFLAPRDIYISAILKNVLKACVSVLAFVGSPQFYPVQKYWIPPPEGINYTTACFIPKRIFNETDEELIEKQVIFDVMLDTRVWADKYITNPFPYIEQDITKISKEDFNIFKKTFFVNLKKYESFRDKIIEGTRKRKLENKNYETPKIEKLTDASDTHINKKL